jgi:hypothetical protein
MRPTLTSRHAGFTLIELLVALAVAITIMAVSVAVLNTGVIESQRIITSADRVSQWLLTAKNRAKRDGRPRGVRFYRSATDPSLLTEAQYIELPETFVPNPLRDVSRGRIVLTYQQSNPATGIVDRRQVFFASTLTSDVNLVRNTVHSGDFLMLPEFGHTYRIEEVRNPSTISLPVPGGSPTTLPAVEFLLGRATPNDSYPDLGAGFTPVPATAGAAHFTHNFAFQLGPRPLFGEPVMQLSPEAVIDARSRAGTPNATSLNVSTTGDFDVLFAPSGQVLNQTVGLLAFLIRDPNKPDGFPSLDPLSNYDTAGEMAIVSVATKTGAIATHPVLPGPDPFLAAKTGINAGF